MVLGMWGLAELARGQTLVDLDQIPSSGLNLELRRFVQIPLDPGNVTPRVNQLTTAPGDNRFFAVTHGFGNGGANTANIYAINPDAPGGPQVSQFLALGSVLNSVNGPIANGVNPNREGGLKSMAFHPDFAQPGAPGYRKFYTSVQEVTASGNTALPYVGSTTITDMADSVIGEWQVGADGAVDLNSYREVLRVALDWFAHPAQSLGFNPYPRPGDDDYGLLYFSHGDAGDERSGTGQLGNNAHGKMLRVNPLQSGGNSYTIPSTNPFTAANDPGGLILDEIYALGLRNSTHFSWAEDHQGSTHLIAGEIGEWNVEEVNIIEAGGNYGWRAREGTFVNNPSSQRIGLGFGISNLPGNDAALNDFIYPAAQYGHVGADGTPFGSLMPVGARGGYVIQNGSDPTLQGQYLFGDFPVTGKLLTASLANLLAAKTKLADGELPTTLAPALVSEVGVLFDNDDNRSTPSVPMSLSDVFLAGPGYDGSGRIDTVFGQGPRGELYITNKRNGWVYLVANTDLPSCDLNTIGNGPCTVADLDLLIANIAAGTNNPSFDLTYDGIVDLDDRNAWLRVAGEKNLGPGKAYLLGDANLDATVDVNDFLAWNINKFTNVAAWSKGDFNADGGVDVSDYHIWNAFKFESSDSVAVPESCSISWIWLVLIAAWRCHRSP